MYSIMLFSQQRLHCSACSIVDPDQVWSRNFRRIRTFQVGLGLGPVLEIFLIFLFFMDIIQYCFISNKQ